MKDDLDRSFEGQEVLQKLLTQSGSLADVDDVAEAFKKAVKQNVPAPVVIQALWEDEPRFNSPDEAAQLFSNLLGLYELVASGATIDLSVKSVKVKREKAQKPEPFAEGAEPFRAQKHFMVAAALRATPSVTAPSPVVPPSPVAPAPEPVIPA